MRLAMTTAKILVTVSVLVACFARIPSLHAQSVAGAEAFSQSASAKSLKNPTTARLLGIFPGLGHLYAGEGGRGAAVAGAAVTLIVISELMGIEECPDSLFGPPDCPPPTAEEIMIGVAALGVIGFSIWDAGRAAKRTNIKRRVADVRLQPTLSMRAQAPSAGLIMAISLR